MSKRIYVGGIPYSTTPEQLEELFAQYGPVNTADIISDRFTGQSKGFGFVEMAEDADADRAIDQLNGSSFGGRNLTVNAAHDRPRTGGGAGARR